MLEQSLAPLRMLRRAYGRLAELEPACYARLDRFYRRYWGRPRQAA